MLYELPQDQVHRVRRLFAELASFNVSIGGVLAGDNPGCVVADDPVAPRTAFMGTPEGAHLGGAIDNPAFQAAFPAYLEDVLFGEKSWRAACFVLTPEWGAALRDLLPRPPQEDARRHYVCHAVQHDWRAHLPDGFSVQQIDAALLEQAAQVEGRGAESWAHVSRWARGGWGSHAAFLEKGFGVVTLHAGEIVSWSLADGRDGAPEPCGGPRRGARCEIGIHTLPAYRRRGLAAITAAAAIEFALAAGYCQVGWHCSEDNPGSIRTAERVGFRLERRYTNYLVFGS